MSDTSFRIKEGTFPLLFLYTDKSEFELKQCIENIDKVIKSLING